MEDGTEAISLCNGEDQRPDASRDRGEIQKPEVRGLECDMGSTEYMTPPKAPDPTCPITH